MKTRKSENKRKLSITRTWAVLLGLALCTSCSEETLVGPNPPSGKEVTLEARIPGLATPTTRGMTNAQEEEVREVDVLVFSLSGSTYVLDEHKQATSVSTSGNMVSFRAKLTVGTNKNIVVLANVRTLLGTPTAGASKASILSALTVSQTSKWRADDGSSSSYDPIPMAGELSGVTITAGGTISGLSLTRMLARIDVQVSTPNFSLSKIHLCNYNQAGQVTPPLLTTGLFDSIPSVHLPAVPNKNTTTPLTYTPSSALTNGGVYESEIYTFESEAASDASGHDNALRKNATCLVLEGVYNGQTYFYRVDFAATQPATAGDNTTVPYMSLLRNYKYVVDITSAAGIGYDNLNEALASYTIPSNLKTRLIYYDLGKVNNIVYNGQYMLGTSTEGGYVDFEQTGGTAQIEVVTDYPGGWAIDASSPALPAWLTMTPPSSLPTTNGQLVFNASSNTDLTDRTATVELKAGRLTQTLTIRQTFEFSFEVVSNPLFVLDGTNKQIEIKTNAPWTAMLVSRGQPGKEVVQDVVGTTLATGTGTMSAEYIPFTTVNDLTSLSIHEGEAEIKVTLSSPSGITKDYSIPVKCVSGVIQPESNSYIVPPGGVGVLIPVSRANKSELGTQLDMSDSFTADLVWTDNANRIAPNSNISLIQAVGTGSTGYVLVRPGSTEGNAVVCIKNAANKILWSWHIWVTSSTPMVQGTGSGYRWMDRNLGAIGNTPGAVGTLGLLYQWGRKDPFPNSTTINGDFEPTIYNATSTTSIVRQPVAVTNNLDKAIAYPTTFYTNSTMLGDWYTTNSSSQNHTLWGHGSTKTVYDPCPAGWRVPSSSLWSNLTEYNFVWNASTCGRTNINYGGFYPASGWRDSNGTLCNVGIGGLYWSASPNDMYGYCLYFYSNSVGPVGHDNRAYGLAVRCVQE